MERHRAARRAAARICGLARLRADALRLCRGAVRQDVDRDAGDHLAERRRMVHLDKWNVYAVARYAEVYAVLNDPLTFCSSRGVGLTDFAKEKPWRPPSLVLEADPPAHTRTRAVLNRALSPAVMKQIRYTFAA